MKISILIFILIFCTTNVEAQTSRQAVSCKKGQPTVLAKMDTSTDFLGTIEFDEVNKVFPILEFKGLYFFTCSDNQDTLRISVLAPYDAEENALWGGYGLTAHNMFFVSAYNGQLTISGIQGTGDKLIVKVIPIDENESVKMGEELSKWLFTQLQKE